MRATALNSGDVRLMRGEPLLVRLFFGLRRPKRPGRGMDVAGVVVACGPDVTAFAPGDEVVGELPGGGMALYVLAPYAIVAFSVFTFVRDYGAQNWGNARTPAKHYAVR